MPDPVPAVTRDQILTAVTEALWQAVGDDAAADEVTSTVWMLLPTQTPQPSTSTAGVRTIAEEAVLALADLAESIRPQFPARAGQCSAQAEELASRLQKHRAPALTREQVYRAIDRAYVDHPLDTTGVFDAMTDAVMSLLHTGAVFRPEDVGSPSTLDDGSCPAGMALLAEAPQRCICGPRDDDPSDPDPDCPQHGRHRCASRPNGHSLGGDRLTHACSCGTRWPLGEPESEETT